MTKTEIAVRYPRAMSWSFGDSPQLADELLALVMAGKKTASCSSLAAYQSEPSPGIGAYNIIEDSHGRARCVVRTIGLTLVNFDQVTPEMAAMEGEGDLSLSDWRQAHKDFFSRAGNFAPDMPLVFERFAVVEILAD